MARAFIIRPFGTKKDGAGNAIDFDRVSKLLIMPALEAAGLPGGTTGDVVASGNIREDMFEMIVEADLVICDVTIHNANVFYELGIRHSLRRTRSIMIKGQPAADSPPFDLLTDRYFTYDLAAVGQEDLVAKLTAVIKATLASERTDSPIFKMLPDLPEADAEAVAQVLPTDLTEEVGRAAIAKSAGWLRLLASEVGGLRFEWPALRIIGQAQWDIEDYDGARETLERVAQTKSDDLAANLALSNLYERQYRREHRPELLLKSDQAINRVLDHGDRLTLEQRAEARSLLGRNQKTRWRLAFEDIPDLTARRVAATNRALWSAYEAYRHAYFTDLNHHWSGLAALQMGTIGIELAKDEAWQDTFNSDEEAANAAAELSSNVSVLRMIVPLAARVALATLPPTDPKRSFAELTPADILFLTVDKPEKVIRAYKDALAKAPAFAWDAARKQLDLFASLGIRSELAAKIVRAVEEWLERPASVERHVVMFVGHQIDGTDRTTPRFPAASEPQARALIRAQLEPLSSSGSQLEVLASASPGSDILCHELCAEMGIPSTLCLPMRSQDYASATFRTLDFWRKRFLELLDKRPVLRLSDGAGLPRWLDGVPGIDPWERGNRWVLQMGLASKAKKVSLLALWDGQEPDTMPGGTAHMVRIARLSGSVDVTVIDANQLLTV